MNGELEQKIKAPWSKYYKQGSMDIKVLDTSVYNYFEHKAYGFRERYCIDYYGNKIKYSDLLEMIDNCAKGLWCNGVRKGDVVSVCLPNTIEGVVSFFAINKLGATVNFIHPASSENEIRDSLNKMKSKVLIVVDTNFFKTNNIISDTNVRKIILVSVYGYTNFIARLRKPIEEKLKIDLAKDKSIYTWWNVFMARTKKMEIEDYSYDGEKDDSAIILHSGGTTGSPKGVVLTNKNLIAFVESAMIFHHYLEKGDNGFALMPIFHGFGLIHSVLFPLCIGMNVILRPKFDVKEYCKMVIKYRPRLMMGVPTLFESIVNEWKNKKFDLKFLKYALVGGDSLKPALREQINNFFKEHEANIKIAEGYGLTEAVCGVALGDANIAKKGKIGIPMPGVYVGIFTPEDEEVPYGQEGEICVSGPTVMQGYYDNEEETNIALHVHKDGNTWLHTGDIGIMDEDGFIEYKSRLKRMIVSSGYNVYPNQIEKILEKHPAVKVCTVVGVPHKYRVEVPKAFIVLAEGYAKSELVTMELKKICKKNLPKYSWPCEYEYLEKLPTTKVGKIDFRKLKEYHKK